MYKFLDEKGEHRHELDGKPLLGTSTVTNIIAKPLTWWASGMAVAELGWTNGKIKENGRYKTIPLEDRLEVAKPHLERLKTLDVAEYLTELDKAYRAHSSGLKKAATKGTNLHAELELYVKEQLGIAPKRLFDTYPEQIKPFIKWAEENVEKWLLSEGHTYSERLWLGGIVDAGAVLKDGRKAIIDFKSSKDAYFNQYIQIALYDIQIGENGVFTKDSEQMLEKFNVDTYIVIPFGAENFMICERKNVADFRRYGEAAVQLYKGSNSFE